MANKVGIRVQDEFGNVKGEDDFAAFQRTCLPLRTHELAAYVRAQGQEVADERKEPLVRQAWKLYSAGAPSPTSKHENEPVFGQHAITQGPPPELEPLEEDPGLDGADTLESAVVAPETAEDDTVPENAG